MDPIFKDLFPELIIGKFKIKISDYLILISIIHKILFEIRFKLT